MIHKGLLKQFNKPLNVSTIGLLIRADKRNTWSTTLLTLTLGDVEFSPDFELVRAK